MNIVPNIWHFSGKESFKKIFMEDTMSKKIPNIVVPPPGPEAGQRLKSGWSRIVK